MANKIKETLPISVVHSPSDGEYYVHFLFGGNTAEEAIHPNNILGTAEGDTVVEFVDVGEKLKVKNSVIALRSLYEIGDDPGSMQEALESILQTAFKLGQKYSVFNPHN